MMNTPSPQQSLPPQYPPAYPQAYPALERTAGPVKVLGIIYAIFAVLSLFGFFAVLALAFVPGIASQSSVSADPISAAAPKLIFGFAAIVVFASTVLHGLTAYGLLALKTWGRTLAIVTGIISLISIPIGTILGGFTLYYLMRQSAEQEYAQLAHSRIGPMADTYSRNPF